MISAIVGFQGLKMPNFCKRYLQVQRKASCRYFGLKKSICDNEYQGGADTSIVKRASAIMNIKAVQIHQLSKKASAQANKPRI